MADHSETGITASEACNFEVPDSQGKHYRKTDFILHSRVADVLGEQLGHVFYDDDENDAWSISARQLRDMVLTNILQERTVDEDTSSSTSTSTTYNSQYPIYGSAIAFEPNVWTRDIGLEKGVTYPAASEACLNNNTSYCTEESGNSYLKLTELKTNNDGSTIYCPYAFRGPDSEIAYDKCSSDQPEFCPSMDLAYAYDYSNVTVKEAEWYTAPRCLYLRDGISSGYWTSPYFDTDAGGINMVTYSQPIISQSGKFLGIATIDVTVDALCYGDQCATQIDYNYLTHIRVVGLLFFAIVAAFSILCVAWTHKFKKERVVIASQPFFLRLICIGCFIMASAIIPLSIDDSIASQEGCSKACMAFPWLLSIGFTATFSALFSKILRLNQVLRNAREHRRVAIREMDVMRPFILLLTVNCAIMAAWTLVDPLVWVRTEPNDKYESHGYCKAEGKASIALLTLLAVLNAVALVFANIEAFRARNITSEFSESQYVMIIMICLVQALFIGVPLLIIVRENAIATYFMRAGLIFVVTTAILGLLFVPKVILVRQRTRNLAESPPSQSTTIENQNNTDGGLELQSPEIVIVTSRGALEPGQGTMMTGKF